MSIQKTLRIGAHHHTTPVRPSKPKGRSNKSALGLAWLINWSRSLWTCRAWCIKNSSSLNLLLAMKASIHQRRVLFKAQCEKGFCLMTYKYHNNNETIRRAKNCLPCIYYSFVNATATNTLLSPSYVNGVLVRLKGVIKRWFH